MLAEAQSSLFAQTTEFRTRVHQFPQIKPNFSSRARNCNPSRVCLKIAIFLNLLRPEAYCFQVINLQIKTQESATQFLPATLRLAPVDRQTDTRRQTEASP